MKGSNSRWHKQVPAQTVTRIFQNYLPRKTPCCSILEGISDGMFTLDINKQVASFNGAAVCVNTKAERRYREMGFQVSRQAGFRLRGGGGNRQPFFS